MSAEDIVRLLAHGEPPLDEMGDCLGCHPSLMVSLKYHAPHCAYGLAVAYCREHDLGPPSHPTS